MQKVYKQKSKQTQKEALAKKWKKESKELQEACENGTLKAYSSVKEIHRDILNNEI